MTISRRSPAKLFGRLIVNRSFDAVLEIVSTGIASRVCKKISSTVTNIRMQGDVVTRMADWDDGQFATLACLLEATAPKPGNVSPVACFGDMEFTDLVTSAVAIGPALRQVR